MLQPCYLHTVPILKPYGRHDGQPDGSRPTTPNIAKNLSIEKCSVAQFIIEETKNFKQKLNYQSNGRLTKLGKHVLECSVCRGESITIEDRENIVTPSSKLVEVELPIYNEFKKWREKNHPSVTESQAIQLLLKYDDFAKREIARLRRYEIKYGDIDRFKER